MSVIPPGSLPPPPAGRSGWPWTTPVPHVSARTPAGAPWPRITIVTPSFGYGRFLEEAIRSVLLQGYPDLEYFVLDGGSTDESVDVLRRYSPWLSHWRSHPDDGQAAAVIEGWDRGTGAIVAYLNSDDVYLPNALIAAAGALVRDPEAGAVCGAELRIDDAGRVLRVLRPRAATLDSLLRMQFLPQPAVFLRRTALTAAGGVNPEYRLTFDFELWVRVAASSTINVIPTALAATREHAARISATRRREVVAELKRFARAASRSGPLRLTRPQRRALAAHLSYGEASVYADALPHDWVRVMGGVTRALIADPALTGELLRATVRRIGRRWNPGSQRAGAAQPQTLAQAEAAQPHKAE